MAKVDDFFIEDNSVDLISEASYENINNIIDEIEAFSRLTYKSVYIIDYYKRNFLYVSKNPLFLCGLSPEEVKELGYNFYINNVPKEDLDFLLEINVKGFEFLKDIPAEDKKKYTISVFVADFIAHLSSFGDSDQLNEIKELYISYVTGLVYGTIEIRGYRINIIQCLSRPNADIAYELNINVL